MKRPPPGMRLTLLKAARRRTTVQYGRLMKRHRLSRGRALTRAIGDIDKKERDSGAPGFAAIIVRKDTGYPGGGFFVDEDLPLQLRRGGHRGSDPRLSPAERAYVRGQQETIWAYYSATSRP